MQIRIEFPGDGVDRLQSIFSQEIVELFENQTHARIDGRAFAFAARGGKAKLKIIDNCDEPLEQRSVGVLDRFFLFACVTLFVILEVGLAAQRQVAKAIKIGLQTGHRILGPGLLYIRRSRAAQFGRRCRSLSCVVRSVFGNLSHVLRMAIRVMSSFCGCDPTKLRRSSISRATMAWAPLPALARTDCMVRSMPNSFPSVSSASVTPSV